MRKENVCIAFQIRRWHQPQSGWLWWWTSGQFPLRQTVLFLLTATVSPYGVCDASRGREIRKLKNSSNLLEYLWLNAKEKNGGALCGWSRNNEPAFGFLSKVLTQVKWYLTWTEALSRLWTSRMFLNLSVDVNRLPGKQSALCRLMHTWIQILGQAFFHLGAVDCFWFVNNTGENNHCSLCMPMNANVLLADGLLF